MSLTRLEVTVAPASEPVSVADAHEHLGLGSISDYDATVLPRLIRVAREWMEMQLRRALITQTLRATYDIDLPTRSPTGIVRAVGRVPRLAFDLVRPPLGSVSLVEMETDIGTYTTLTAGTHYKTDSGIEPARVYLTASALSQWSPASVLGVYNGYESPKVRVTYTAGYGSSGSSVPSPIYQAMLAVIAHLFENRESNAPIPDDLAPSDWRVRYLL
jgi:uncharacterized phiE125 gp8 family phage protein